MELAYSIINKLINNKGSISFYVFLHYTNIKEFNIYQLGDKLNISHSMMARIVYSIDNYLDRQKNIRGIKGTNFKVKKISKTIIQNGTFNVRDDKINIMINNLTDIDYRNGFKYYVTYEYLKQRYNISDRELLIKLTNEMLNIVYNKAIYSKYIELYNI